MSGDKHTEHIHRLYPMNDPELERPNTHTSRVARVDDHHNSRFTLIPGCLDQIPQVFSVDGPIFGLIQVVANLRGVGSYMCINIDILVGMNILAFF